MGKVQKSLSFFGVIVFLFILSIIFSTRRSHAVLSATDHKIASQFEHTVILPTPTYTPIPTLMPTETFTPIPTVIPTSQITTDPTNDSVWDQLATCESNNHWDDDTGNGYYGGLQFSLSAWVSVGGIGKPSDASRDDQIAKGKLLQARRGWSPWGACSRKLGLQ